ncbi:MAG: nucleotide sugar dehydrogenase, partial [Verrucomicrobia bacterium]
YLTWKAREYGKQTRFIELAGEVNTAMPEYVVSRVTDALNENRKPVKGSRILLLGLAYKADVDDLRESPAFILMDLLKNRGVEISYHDPHIPVIRPTREHSHWAGTKSVAWDRGTISAFDAVVICTAHRAVNYRELAEWAGCLVDSRNAMAGIPTKPGQVWKA